MSSNSSFNPKQLRAEIAQMRQIVDQYPVGGVVAATYVAKGTEQVLRAVFLRVLPELDEATQAMIQQKIERIDNKKVGVEKFTFGQLNNLFEATQFFKHYERLLEKRVRVAKLISMKEFVQLRNQLAHVQDEAQTVEITREDAKFLLQCLELFIDSFATDRRSLVVQKRPFFMAMAGMLGGIVLGAVLVWWLTLDRSFAMTLYFRDAENDRFLLQAQGVVTLVLEEAKKVSLVDGKAHFTEIPAHYLGKPMRLDVQMPSYRLLTDLALTYQRGEVKVLLQPLPKLSPAEECLQDLQQRADKGDSRAWAKLGLAYYDGECHVYQVMQNYRKAFAAFEQAALLDQAVAQYYLGVMYARGQGGIAIDHQQAASWLRKSASQGNCLAANHLANLVVAAKVSANEFGQPDELRVCLYAMEPLRFAKLGVLFKEMADPDLVVDWLAEQANDATNPQRVQAAYWLGYLAETGLWMRQDVAGAKAWYQFAAGLESPAAAGRLQAIERGEVLSQPAVGNRGGFEWFNEVEAGSSFRDCSYCPEMVWIPATDNFTIGSPSDEKGRDDDEDQKTGLRIGRFAMGKYEVTFAEYDRFALATGRDKPDDEGWGRGNRPVINVNWHDAVAYAAWLSEQTGQDYRLPTEAEWEYAARGGTRTARYWGDDPSAACEYANVADQAGKREFNWSRVHNCDDKYIHTSPVGALENNGYALHDILGNVWEWTCSEYTSSYNGNETRCVSKNDASRPVLRGGSWYDLPDWVRSAYRYYSSASSRTNGIGFRLARK